MIITLKPYIKKIKYIKNSKSKIYRGKNFKLNVISYDKCSTSSLLNKQLEILKYTVREAHIKFPKHRLVAIQRENNDEFILAYIGVKLKSRAQNKIIWRHNAKFRKII